MCPTLFYIPPTLLGLPLFGHKGLLLGLALLVTLIALGVRCVRRRGWDDECWSYVAFGAVVALLVAWIAPGVLEPRGFPIRGYGVLLLLAIVCSFGLLYWRLKRKQYFSTDLLFSMSLWTVVCGILGARLFYVIEYRREMLAYDAAGGFDVLRTAINVVNIAEGGLVVYGSILAGTATVIVFLLRHKLPVFKTLDLLAPSLLLGMTLGRIGCFLNGCCFGAVCPAEYQDYGVRFPLESPAHRHQVEKGEVPFLGLVFRDVATETAPADPHAKNGSHAVEIASVVPGSPAEKAGVRPGMHIKAIGIPDGSRITASIVADAADAGRQLLFFVKTLENAALSETGPQSRYIVLIDDGPAERRFFLEVQTLDKENAAALGTVLPVYPMQLISSAGNFLLCGLLLLLGRFCRRDGIVFAAFLFLYSTMRFCLEIFRDDEPAILAGCTIAQCVSVLLFLASIAVFCFLVTRGRSVKCKV